VCETLRAMNHPSTLSETRPPPALAGRSSSPRELRLPLGWKAAHGLLRAATAVAVGLALLAAGLDVWRFVAALAERRAKAGMDVPLPPPAGFRIAVSDGMRRYRRLTIDWDS
jgi:hypothetical protein